MHEHFPFAEQLSSIDWADEWKRLQIARKAADDPAFWDERSKTYHKGRESSPYAQRFIELSGIRPGDSVFDMGCGTGVLSIPLGLAGHEVIAADFSQGMLKQLEEECAKRNISSVKAINMSWDSDWASYGVSENCVDVAVASRSIATADLRDSLHRLTSVARRRACVTLPTGPSPRTDERILNSIGIKGRTGRDFLYAFMILTQMGLLPEVRYIPSIRADTYSSPAEAFDSLAKMVHDAASNLISAEDLQDSLDNLRDWLPENLISNPHEGMPGKSGEPQKAFMLKEPRVITWAHISWSTER